MRRCQRNFTMGKSLIVGFLILVLAPPLESCSIKTMNSSGRMSACPDSPNCVFSGGSQEDKRHYIEPLTYKGEAKRSFATLCQVVSSIDRVVLREKDDKYLRFECKSKLWGFVDDLEFQLDEANKLIHVRSASRVGHSDMGVNRKRVEQIRALFIEKM